MTDTLPSFIEHDAVVRSICKSNEARFDVLNNLEGEKNYIANIFPDIILKDKTSGKLVFIIEVKKNGNIAPCIQQWKALPSVPATLYIVVPEVDLNNAKSIAQVVGLKIKFGTYSIDNTQRVSVKYDN